MNENIEYIEIKKIKPYKNNAKNHPTDQIQKIANSIEKFGFKIPILIDKDNVIISGHGRYKACQLLNIDKIPAIKITDLNDSEIKMLRIADNKVAESDWDLDILKKELDELNDTFDLKDFEIETITDETIQEIDDATDEILEYKDTPISPEIGFHSKFKVIKFDTREEFDEFENRLDYVKSPNFTKENNIELEKEAVITYKRIMEIFR